MANPDKYPFSTATRLIARMASDMASDRMAKIQHSKHPSFVNVNYRRTAPKELSPDNPLGRETMARRVARQFCWLEEVHSCSLLDLKNRSEKVAGQAQILTILQANSCSIGQKKRWNMDRPDAFAADFL